MGVCVPVKYKLHMYVCVYVCLYVCVCVCVCVCLSVTLTFHSYSLTKFNDFSLLSFLSNYITIGCVYVVCVCVCVCNFDLSLLLFDKI